MSEPRLQHPMEVLPELQNTHRKFREAVEEKDFSTLVRISFSGKSWSFCAVYIVSCGELVTYIGKENMNI